MKENTLYFPLYLSDLHLALETVLIRENKDETDKTNSSSEWNILQSLMLGAHEDLLDTLNNMPHEQPVRNTHLNSGYCKGGESALACLIVLLPSFSLAEMSMGRNEKTRLYSTTFCSTKRIPQRHMYVLKKFIVNVFKIH